MPEYRLYHFKGDRIRHVDTVTAGDDLEAIGKAETLTNGRKAELWRGGCKVRAFDRSGT